MASATIMSSAKMLRSYRGLARVSPFCLFLECAWSCIHSVHKERPQTKIGLGASGFARKTRGDGGTGTPRVLGWAAWEALH